MTKMNSHVVGCTHDVRSLAGRRVWALASRFGVRTDPGKWWPRLGPR